MESPRYDRPLGLFDVVGPSAQALKAESNFMLAKSNSDALSNKWVTKDYKKSIDDWIDANSSAMPESLGGSDFQKEYDNFTDELGQVFTDATRNDYLGWNTFSAGTWGDSAKPKPRKAADEKTKY